jgi:hypothetical protein
MFQEWGLAEVMTSEATPEVENGFFIDGHAMPMEVDQEDNESLFIPQQVLVRNPATLWALPHCGRRGLASTARRSMAPLVGCWPWHCPRS